MTQLATLPDGRQIHCVNTYEVDFSVHEIFNDDLESHGIELPADGVYLDVGANIGLFALHLLDVCPTARVFAYEPMPEAFAALEKNLTGRGMAFALGLGAAPGTAEFEYFPGITALSSCHGAVSAEMARGLKRMLAGAPADAEVADILDKTGAAERTAADPAFVEQLFTTCKVQATIDTLSHQIRQHGLERIDLLKIDTEGAEKEVLAGLDEDHWPLVRQMVVEVHLGREETDLMERQLQARGFRTQIGHHPLSNSGVPVFHIYAKRD
ncbi:MAG: FkbM family methyltransferase [Sterolibacteriaceae bacterium MAG5]|nr:FkbM family methyltransferase [Candidatus Nitricoxidireducens bremensis]